MRMVYEPTAQGMHHWKCEVGGEGPKKKTNLALWLLLKKIYHTFPECPASSRPHISNGVSQSETSAGTRFLRRLRAPTLV